MADISVDTLRFTAKKEIKEHPLFGRHLKELRKWIKEVALEGKQEMIPHEDTAVPETPCAANLPTPEVLSRSDEFVCLHFFFHVEFFLKFLSSRTYFTISLYELFCQRLLTYF